ncbi:alkene reductase [Streptomyces shenzhenensis]|uniref:alkene reductase n=1 Tax=Streptomyces shenzhenensis TaxID=943815 RepID=UPI0038224340
MSKLFTPVAVGPLTLRNRIVMPPMTRNRAGNGFVPTSEMALYYTQRASAGLQIAEGATVGPHAIGYPRTPGIHTAAQVEGWRRVTEAVHAQGGTMFLQLWHVGRVSHPHTQPNGERPVAPSEIPVTSAKIFTDRGLQEFVTPRALETDEIADVVNEYAAAARNAQLAGFDGVEVHAANGYLIEQFLNDGVNQRTDAYGGSIANRSRFLWEVLDAVTGVWGSNQVGVRLSPSATWMDAIDSDKRSLFTHVVQELAKRHLAYLHLLEPTASGGGTVTKPEDHIPTKYFRDLYDGTVIATGDHTADSAQAALEDGSADLIGFGRLFIANPDLPARIAARAPLNEPLREHFYGGTERGYTDYPSMVDELRHQ